MGRWRGSHAEHVHRHRERARVRETESLHYLTARSVLRRRFRYTFTLRDAFLRDGIALLQDLDNRGWVAASYANAFVCNHDTERVRSFRWQSFSELNNTSRRSATPSTLIRPQTRTYWPLSFPCMRLYCRLFKDGVLRQIRLHLCSAHPYGTISILSSYSNFYDKDVGGPNGGTTCAPPIFSQTVLKPLQAQEPVRTLST